MQQLSLPELLGKFENVRVAIERDTSGILKSHLNQLFRGILSHPEAYKLSLGVKGEIRGVVQSLKKLKISK